MGFELIYCIYMGSYYFLVGFNLEKCGNLGKTAIFSVRYGWIGDMQHGRIWPDWGLKGKNVPVWGPSQQNWNISQTNYPFLICNTSN